MNLKVVLDTNIFISGIHWNGPSYKILQAWFEDRCEFICSTEILEEIVKTLKEFKVPLSKEEINWWENLILEKSTIVNPSEKIDIVKDQDDNKFIEAAIEGKASYIISQDKHLLVIKEYRGIKIVTPEDYLKLTSNN